MGKQKTAVYLNICTLLGLAAMALFIWYGIRTGIFVSAESLEAFLGKFGLWAPVCFVPHPGNQRLLFFSAAVLHTIL